MEHLSPNEVCDDGNTMDGDACNAGNPGGCLNRFGNPITEDQRGMPRATNNRCDIGAYEK